MKIISKYFLFFLSSLVSLYSFGQINSNSPAIPFGSISSYDYGMMPTNLPSNGTYGQSQDAADAWLAFKADYVENCGDNAARVKFDDESQTVSEGIAYTMLLAVYAADQDVFNKLWQFYKNHRNANGVMHWRISGCNTVTGQNGATDAEVDAAMALIVADKQWGSAGQVHNYKSDAIDLINIIEDHEINSSDKTFENGDMWKPDCRNPSYQAPGYARVWELFMEENGYDGSFWNSVAVATEGLHVTNSNTYDSGLASNWCQSNGIANSGCSGSGTNWAAFGYDACRAPWRQSIDYLWHGSTANGMQSIINNQVGFWIGNGGAGNVSGGDSRHQNGSGSGDHNGAFIGMIGAQSLAASTTSANQSFVNDIYSENVSVNNGGYFVQVLRCLGLFVQSGNFWNPYSDEILGVERSISIVVSNPVVNEFVLGDLVSFNVSASTVSGGITSINLEENGTVLASSSGSTLVFSSSGFEVGDHVITVNVSNSEGDMESSEIVFTVLETVFKVNEGPVVDGAIEQLWDYVTGNDLGNVIVGEVSNNDDLTGEYKALWDNENLYVLIDVVDESRNNNSTNAYEDDAVELFIDINNDKSSTYGNDDYQFTFGFGDAEATESKHGSVAGVVFAQIAKVAGYTIEVSIPWSLLNTSPNEGDFVGFDVAVNDDDSDTGDGRDSKISWHTNDDFSWSDPSLFGTVVLGSELDLCSNAPTPVIIAEDTICLNSSIVEVLLSVNGDPGSSYFWSTEIGEIKTDRASNEILLELSSNELGNVSVVETNSLGCESSEVHHSFKYDCVTSVSTGTKIAIELFPNPSTGLVYVSEDVSYEIYLPNGSFVRSGKSTLNGVDLSDAEKGIYLVKLLSSGGVKVFKVFIE